MVRSLFAFLLTGLVANATSVWPGVVFSQEAGPNNKPAVNYRSPAREYQDFNSGGWSIKVEKQLLVEDQGLAQQAYARLQQKLAFLLTLVPKHSHADLQKVPIYLMYGPQATGGGEDSGANYYQVSAPDSHPQLDPRWRSCVVIKSARNYVDLADLWSVKVILHELGHAWHLTHWPEQQPEMLTAWQNATQRGLYQNVTDVINGKQFSRAYALTNQLEYFAELTCMYFFGCNYPPVSRRELQLYDPVGFAMIEKMWRVSETSEAPKSAAKKPKAVAESASARAARKPINAAPKPARPASSSPGSTTKEYRQWTNTADGNQFEAEFAGALSGKARLRKKDGTVVNILIENLSKEDQDWIRNRRR